jgi:hypothetical protein
MGLSAAPLKFRQQVHSELWIVERICELPQPEMKTVTALVRRLIKVMDELDRTAAEGLRAWADND